MLERELTEDLDEQSFRTRALLAEEVLAERAIVLAACGHYAAATAALAKARALGPKSPAVSAASGRVYLFQANTTDAARAFGDSIHQGTKSFVSYYAAGTMVAGEGPSVDRRARIRLLRQATTLNPRFVLALLELSRLLADDGQLTAALRWAQTAVSLEPTRGTAWVMLGRHLLGIQDVDTARLAGQRGFSWARDEESRKQIVVLLNEVGQYEQSRIQSEIAGGLPRRTHGASRK